MLKNKYPILEYSVKTDLGREVNLVEIYGENNFFELECLADSPYSIEEEIQNYLDDNDDDIEYEFLKK